MNEYEPVVISGIGGSGTRIVATIVRRYGYWLGDNINDAYDNIYFSGMIRSLKKPFMTKEMLEDFFKKNGVREKFGWKEPNAHVYLADLCMFLPNMKYIHVMRNAKDLACRPKIDRQFQRFASRFLTRSKEDFVNKVNKRAMEIMENFERSLLVKYEELCSDPEKVIREIGELLGEDYNPLLPGLVYPSKNIGCGEKIS